MVYILPNHLQISHFSVFERFELFSQNSLGIQALMRTNMGGGAHRKMPKNLRYPRRAKVPPDPTINIFIKKMNTESSPSLTDSNDAEGNHDENDLSWHPDEIEVISSLFQGRIPQKFGKSTKERPLPLPIPHKIRPLGFPTPKRHIRSVSRVRLLSRTSLSNRVYKNPDMLIALAREIRNLPLEVDASEVLDKWLRFLRKGSLSLTIRELGHMGLPERALQTFCWAQKHPQFYPDDRILASTVEILARTRRLKMPIELEKFMSSASRNVIEAMARGFIRAGSFNLARKLLLIAKDKKRTLDPSIHAKLILELGKNPDKYKLVSALLEELGEREDFSLKQQDCTAVMKVCIRLGKFEAVESLYSWFRESGNNPTIVMYTTVIHSRYSEKKYREALKLVWEMEQLNCLLDLPAYRVVIKVCVALNDLARSMRYFLKLKEAGFSPSYDIFRDIIKVYALSGRWSKVKELCREVEMAGFRLDNDIRSLLLQVEGAAA